MQDVKYDVFLSFTGDDRETVRPLARELGGLGVRVFFDDVEIGHHSGITDVILDALRSSRVFVPFYSAAYARRPCCQQELMEVFLAGQQEGDPCGRILVINPMEDDRHLRPIELADARFTRWDDSPEGCLDLAQRIAKRALAESGTIGAYDDAPSSWPGSRVAGHLKRFTGRHAELWDLHSALHRDRYRIAMACDFGRIAALCGLPGAGKSAVAAAYAWRFRAAYPGGIEWLSLAEASPRARLRAPRDGLVVVDDIPSEADGDLVDELVSRWEARVLLISEADVFGALMPVVPLAGLAPRCATALLDSFREPDNERDVVAQSDLVALFGGNPGALTTIGEYLAERQGLASYASVLAEIRAGAGVAEKAVAPVRRMLGGLSAVELDVVRGNGFAASGVDVSTAGTVLKRLRVLGMASRDGRTWSIDPLVLRGMEFSRDRRARRSAGWSACVG